MPTWEKGNPHWHDINSTMGKIKVQGGAHYLDKADPLRKDYDATWSNAKGEWEFVSSAPEFVRGVQARLLTDNKADIARFEYKLIEGPFVAPRSFDTVDAFVGHLDTLRLRSARRSQRKHPRPPSRDPPWLCTARNVSTRPRARRRCSGPTSQRHPQSSRSGTNRATEGGCRPVHTLMPIKKIPPTAALACWKT